jgi:predicted nucleotide-binding protein
MDKSPAEELFEISERLKNLSKRSTHPSVEMPLKKLEEAASKIQKAWSGSSIGYHAYVYYKGLLPPPPGAHFSPEWGLKDTIVRSYSTGDWEEFDPDQVRREIFNLADNPDLENAKDLEKEAKTFFNTGKEDVLSILTNRLSEKEDQYLFSIKEKVEKLSILSSQEIISGFLPKNYYSRDSLAVTQGLKYAPHFVVLSEVISIRAAFSTCEKLSTIAEHAGSHLARLEKHAEECREIGKNIFIGHGNSLIWRELKDFVADRLRLPWDEFNRVPVAGVTNIDRLAEMLDSAVIAFLVFTGEDEQVDGAFHARMNVIHEAGLFQGRLGFTKAIVLLEEGCAEFTNIQGYGQIRFPKGQISAVFEDIRRVLEREGILKAS